MKPWQAAAVGFSTGIARGLAKSMEYQQKLELANAKAVKEKNNAEIANLKSLLKTVDKTSPAYHNYNLKLQNKLRSTLDPNYSPMTPLDYRKTPIFKNSFKLSNIEDWGGETYRDARKNEILRDFLPSEEHHDLLQELKTADVKEKQATEELQQRSLRLKAVLRQMELEKAFSERMDDVKGLTDEQKEIRKNFNQIAIMQGGIPPREAVDLGPDSDWSKNYNQTIDNLVSVMKKMGHTQYAYREENLLKSTEDVDVSKQIKAMMPEARGADPIGDTTLGVARDRKKSPLSIPTAEDPIDLDDRFNNIMQKYQGATQVATQGATQGATQETILEPDAIDLEKKTAMNPRIPVPSLARGKETSIDNLYNDFKAKLDKLLPHNLSLRGDKRSGGPYNITNVTSADSLHGDEMVDVYKDLIEFSDGRSFRDHFSEGFSKSSKEELQGMYGTSDTEEAHEIAVALFKRMREPQVSQDNNKEEAEERENTKNDLLRPVKIPTRDKIKSTKLQEFYKETAMEIADKSEGGTVDEWWVNMSVKERQDFVNKTSEDSDTIKTKLNTLIKRMKK